jgi:hypothetical protein
MNTSNHNPETEQDFDQDMNNDSVVQLYRRVLTTEKAPSHLEGLIFKSYQKTIRPSFWKRWLCRITVDGNWGFNWPVANALAAGVLMGVLLPPLLGEFTGTSGNNKSITDFRGSQPEAQSTSNKQQTEPLTPDIEQNPNRWLERIASLVYEGHLAEAEGELVNFKLKYPHYETPWQEQDGAH